MQEFEDRIMNVYRGSYSETWNYGGFQDYEVIVVANTESEALGMVLEEISDSRSDNWYIDQIDTSTPRVMQTSERSS